MVTIPALAASHLSRRKRSVGMPLHGYVEQKCIYENIGTWKHRGALRCETAFQHSALGRVLGPLKGKATSRPNCETLAFYVMVGITSGWIDVYNVCSSLPRIHRKLRPGSPKTWPFLLKMENHLRQISSFGLKMLIFRGYRASNLSLFPCYCDPGALQELYSSEQVQEMMKGRALPVVSGNQNGTGQYRPAQVYWFPILWQIGVDLSKPAPDVAGDFKKKKICWSFWISLLGQFPLTRCLSLGSVIQSCWFHFGMNVLVQMLHMHVYIIYVAYKRTSTRPRPQQKR